MMITRPINQNAVVPISSTLVVSSPAFTSTSIAFNSGWWQKHGLLGIIGFTNHPNQQNLQCYFPTASAAQAAQICKHISHIKIRYWDCSCRSLTCFGPVVCFFFFPFYTNSAFGCITAAVGPMLSTFIKCIKA